MEVVFLRVYSTEKAVAALFAVTCLIYITSYFDVFFSGIRYVKYFLPILIIPFYLHYSRMYQGLYFYNTPEVRPYLFLLLYGVGLLILSGGEFKDLYFYFVTFSFFAFIPNLLSAAVVDRVFFVLSFLFIIASLKYGSGGISLIDSKGLYEGTESFLFGLYVLWFMYRGRKSLALFALILVVVSFKRVVLLAVFASMCLYYIFIVLSSRNMVTVFLKRALYFLPFLLLVVSVGFSSGYFSDLVSENFDYSIDHLTMGRFVMASHVYDVLSDGKLVFFGSGPGSVYAHVDNITQGRDVNLHNDYLKLYLEFGFFGFLVFFSFLYRDVIRDSSHFSVFWLYLCILFFTDNVLVYPQVIFFYFAMVRILKNEK